MSFGQNSSAKITTTCPACLMRLMICVHLAIVLYMICIPHTGFWLYEHNFTQFWSDLLLMLLLRTTAMILTISIAGLIFKHSMRLASNYSPLAFALFLEKLRPGLKIFDDKRRRPTKHAPSPDVYRTPRSLLKLSVTLPPFAYVLCCSLFCVTSFILFHFIHSGVKPIDLCSFSTMFLYYFSNL